MLLHTPDDLGVTLVVASIGGTAFALCHPGLDGPPDMMTSVVFALDPPAFRVIRQFDTEIVSMVALEGVLYCVDASQHVSIYDSGTWRDIGNPDLRPYRINDLRVVEGEVFGIGNDRMIFVWRDDRWHALTIEEKGLYLYDIATLGSGRYILSGEIGYLATLEGRSFARIDLSTNADLTCVLPLADRRTLVTGWDATLMIVTEEEAELLDVGGRELNFLNAVIWNGRILIAAEDEILELKGNSIATFAAERAALLNTIGARLWRQGVDGIGYLDPGASWIAMPLSATIED